MSNLSTPVFLRRSAAKILSDVKRRDYWLAEAQKWEKCAEDSDDISVSYQIKDIRLVPRPD